MNGLIGNPTHKHYFDTPRLFGEVVQDMYSHAQLVHQAIFTEAIFCNDSQFITYVCNCCSIVTIRYKTNETRQHDIIFLINNGFLFQQERLRRDCRISQKSYLCHFNQSKYSKNKV